MSMKTSTLTLFIALISGLVVSPVALSHGGATGIVKERMELMEGIGEQMKRMGAMAKGKVPFDSQAFAEGAQLVVEGAPKMPALFPEGSLQHPTEALPRIWEDWKRFEESTQQLEVEAEKLRAVAANGDRRAVISQFARMGKICSSCHKSFRKKKSKD